MICFAWWGFPQYAARCVGAFADSVEEQVCVVATRPTVPVKGMEELCKCKVIWIEPNENRPIFDLLGEVPRVLFTSGWAIPAFNRFAVDVKSAHGKVIAMVDNNFVFSVKEALRAIRFRLSLRRKFDGYFVPGLSSSHLLRFYGVPGRLIARGLYSADESMFLDGMPINYRSKNIVYIGQFIARKNVMRLLEAFVKARQAGHDEWHLHMYGCGPLKETLMRLEDCNIHVHDFLQPEKLPAVYQNARIFCLPSLEEHWGLVVHEAALSGCLLLLSTGIGAAADLLVQKENTDGYVNGRTFDANNVEQFSIAMCDLMSLSEDEALEGQQESLRSARQITRADFVLGAKVLADIR